MLFNSLEYLLFFPVVILLFFFTPKKQRWILLLLASYYFYASWNWKFLSLIILSTIVDFFISHQIHRSEKKKERKFFLICSLCVNLGLLVIFKYNNFFIDNLNFSFEFLGLNQFLINNVDWLLPMGISFYTFQTMAYTIDVYNERIEPASHFGKFALYVSFFPQLVAGPIERASSLLPQINKLDADYDDNRFMLGGQQILWGLFKKVVIADRLSIYVSQIYENPEIFGGANLLIATVFFVIQVYCDFSGYSDMAIGSARILGVNLMDNFKFPYFSTNWGEFWRRWHISLSSWILDYLYNPIALNTRNWGMYGIVFALSMTFTLNGFWHGANWTFIAWGVILSLYIVIEFLLKSQRRKLKKRLGKKKNNALGWLTIMVLWTFSCIFFRANNIGDALYIVGSISDLSSWFDNFRPTVQYFGFFSLLISLIFITWLIIIECILYKKDTLTFPTNNFVSIICFVSIIWFGEFNGQQFIYFQF